MSLEARVFRLERAFEEAFKGATVYWALKDLDDRHPPEEAP